MDKNVKNLIESLDGANIQLDYGEKIEVNILLPQSIEIDVFNSLLNIAEVAGLELESIGVTHYDNMHDLRITFIEVDE